MRKTYLMLLALVLTTMGVTNAMGQKIYRAELDKSYFKAWTSWEPGATEVAEPEAIDDGANAFVCDVNLYKSLGAGKMVYGNNNVYYLWYADITGTQKLIINGTAGVQLRVLINRPAPVEGGDAHGGTTVEINPTIGADGTVEVDLSSYEYVHLNAIKTGWGSPDGSIKSIEMVGTVKPVTGVLSVINNGNAEGTDLESFPVSYDGPNNGGTANDKPEVVEGGVDGGKCFKVATFPEPTETWHTQFYIKSDEVMPKGSKWILKMSVKADREMKVTTSSQAAPRSWLGGFINEFSVGTEWKDYTFTGEIGVDGFQSAAIDLNNGTERNANDDGWLPGNGGAVFYFDNIEFGYDLGSASPMNDVNLSYGADVIQVNLNGMTNMNKLVGDNKVLVYPNECATVTWNGKPCTILSVEGRPDGNLYIFLNDIDGDTDFSDDEANVVVGFVNPKDEAFHLSFTDGKFAGEDVPDFSGVSCAYFDDLSMGDYYSYLWGEAQLVSVAPENGSFNLPTDTKSFTVTFNQSVIANTVKAKLNNKAMTVSPAEGSSDTFTLTRTDDAALSGKAQLVITGATAEKSEIEIEDAIVLEYSFGPVVDDPNDKQEDIYVANFTSDGDDANGAGWKVNADAGGLQDANSGGGCRILHSQGAFVEDLVYIAQRSGDNCPSGVALYGLDEEHRLTLKNKTYHVTLGACRHDRNDVALLVQVLPLSAVNEDGTLNDETAVLAEKREEITPEKSSKQAIRFDLSVNIPEAGDYVIRLVPSKASSGAYAGYEDAVCFGDVKVEYIPDIMGLLEVKALNASLDKAKSAREEASDERYDGAAFTAVEAAIAKYDGKVGEMTAPSAFAKGVEELDAATEGINAHKKLCDEYDALPGNAYNILVANKGTKFAPTKYYTAIKNMVDKYCTVENQEAVDEEGNTVVMEVLVAHKILKDDKELTAAKDELSAAIDQANKMFFEGKSHNWYGGGDRTTGYAAEHERLRRGVALLESLGITSDNEAIVRANAELGDNDEVANALVKAATVAILGDLATGDSQLFAVTVDENEELVTPSYDLSVFMKNPNIYSPAYSTDLPGWVSARGNCYVFPGWGASHDTTTPYPEDCQIHAGWHPGGYPMAEQTIENLPAGIYTIKIDGSDNNSTVSAGTYGYVKTSDTPEMGADDVLDPDLHFAGYVACSGNIEEIVVTDGKLTVGFSYGPESQAFINDVEIWMTNYLSDHDYATDYTTDINAPAKAAKVVRVQLFDANGKAIPTAKKGVVFVKKTMSDGTVVVDKVLK